MDNYQAFWNNELSGEGYLQLVLDWDVFIRNFATAIATYAHYDLNPTQREFIRAKIDPQRRGEVCKAAFLLFAQDYWDIPSNRTNLFKMRINLTNVFPRLTLLTSNTPQRLTFTVAYISSGTKITKKYEYKEDVLHCIDQKGFLAGQIKLGEKGFITVGSGNSCDIAIADALFVNKTHLKIASTRTIVKSSKKKSYFQEKEKDNIELVEWFVRDTAKSNRLRYILDTPHKYVFLKPGMVISLGFTGDLQVQVKQINNSTTEVVVPVAQQQQIRSLLNADRINFMGEVDRSVPLKTTLDMDFKEISSRQIEEMLKEKLYYPARDTYRGKVTQKKEAPSLNLIIFNRRTFESHQINALEPTFTIGRSKACKYRFNDISVREQELLFRCFNGFWTVSNPNVPETCSFEINQPSVFLTSQHGLDNAKVSNRVQIQQGSPYRLRGKQFEVEIELTEAKQGDNEED